jgi:hypothetical protein
MVIAMHIARARGVRIVVLSETIVAVQYVQNDLPVLGPPARVGALGGS